MKGHLRERPEGSGNWYAVIDLRDPSTGKRKRKWHSLKADGKRQAQIECAGIISSIEAGTYLEPDKTTLAVFVHHWLNDVKSRVSPRTVETYTQIARANIIPMLGGTILRDLLAGLRVIPFMGRPISNGLHLSGIEICWLT